MSRITMKQMAEHFNVSTATISKALRDLPDISDKLKADILSYAHENNYFPNYTARSLKNGRTNTIGVIISEMVNPVYNMILSGAAEVLYANGYDMILCDSKEDIHRESSYINMLIHRNIDGLLIIPANSKDNAAQMRSLDMINDYDVPFVLMNRYFQGYNSDIVVPDDALMSYLGTNHLIKKGHKKILHFTTEFNTTTVLARISGFKKALNEAGIPIEEQDILRSKRDKQSVYENTIMFFSKEENKKYTAISCYNDLMALQIIRGLIDCGLRVPEDVAVIGNDNIDYAETSMVPLTTVILNTREIGRVAATLVLDKILGMHAKDAATPTTDRYVIKPLGILERKSV